MLPIERATSSQGFSHFQRDQRLKDNVADCYGGPQLSRQNQKPHGKNKIPHGKTENLTAKTKTSRQNQKPHCKTKDLTAKPNTSQQKPNTSRQKQIPTAKPKLFCFCCEVFGFAVRFLVLS